MALSLDELKVLVRGGGEMASGIAHRLHHCHMKVFITEQARPTTVRRTVAFAEAVYQGSQVVEGLRAVRISRPEEAHEVWAQDCIPLFVDPEAAAREVIQPQVVVDAIMDKRSAGTDQSYAPLVIGVGPGFTVGKNVHAVVESNRGYNLGRVLETHRLVKVQSGFQWDFHVTVHRTVNGFNIFGERLRIFGWYLGVNP